jgi:hypothetical protein
VAGRDARSYAELLKDPRWQRKRLEVLQRDEWACTWCGQADVTLHVHHRKYLRGRPPWESPAKDLCTLCEICHADVTRWNRMARELLEDLDFAQLVRAVGYLQGLDMATYPMATVAIENPTHAQGIGDAVGLSGDEVMAKAPEADPRIVDGYLLLGVPPEEPDGKP